MTSSVHVLGALLVCTACARSPDPRLYTLSATQGAAATQAAAVNSAPPRVEVRLPSIAGYLDRPEIVRSVLAQRLQVDERERWAEPLAAMLSRVLAEDLTLRLPNTQVWTELGTVHASPDARIELDFQRFEQQNDDVVLRATLAIHGADAANANVETVEVRAPVRSDGVVPLIEAMTAALGKLADHIAARLARPL